MAILATKSGWLISVKVIRKTTKAVIVKAWDEKHERRVANNSTTQKLFDSTDEALTWINQEKHDESV